MRFPHWLLLIAVLVALAWCVLEAAVSDDVLHPPPDCGPYAYETFNPTSAAMPAKGSSYIDPVFGSAIWRLTNIYPTAEGSSTIYGINGKWNADSTVYMHGDVGASGEQLINPANGTVIRINVPYAGTGAVSFDPVNPDIYYYTNGLNLSSYSVSGNTSATVKTFGSTLGGLGQSSDWIDRTGRYFLLNVGGFMRIWDKQTDTLYTGSIAVPNGGAGAGIPPGWAGLSPDGNYVVVSISPSVSEMTSYAINHGTTTLSTTGVMFWSIGNTDHGDVVSTSDGNNYVITSNNATSPAGCLPRGFWRVKITNNAAGLNCTDQQALSDNRRLIGIPNITGVVGRSHFACAAKGTYQDWCYLSIEDVDDTQGAPGTWYPYKQEIVMIHMLAPFEIRRLAHHRSRPVQASGGYCRLPRVNANWDGTKVMFTTCMNIPSAAGCGYSDLYRIDAP
jgi:hypothetical protein